MIRQVEKSILEVEGKWYYMETQIYAKEHRVTVMVKKKLWVNINDFFF